MKKIYPIGGMHCVSCELIIQKSIEEVSGVKVLSVSARKQQLEVEFVNEKYADALEHKIQNIVKKLGYTRGARPAKVLFSADPLRWGLVILTLVVVGILVLIARDQGWSLNVLSSSVGSQNLLLFPLFMGLIAGVSTCMAMVGGLVLAISAKWNEAHQSLTAWQRFRPQLIFQAGRVLGFSFFGGLLGLLGQIVIFDGQNIAIGLIVVGIVMLILGLDLTRLVPGIRALTIKLPFSINTKGTNRGAFLGGILTFFLPCGFTLSMWILAMATGGSFFFGALVLGSFALGTMPGLLGIGALTAWIKERTAQYIFPVIGALVSVFAVSTLVQGVNLFGYDGLLESTATRPTETQTILYTEKGIFPQEIRLKQGNTYILKLQSQVTLQGCMSTILLPGLDSHISPVEKGKEIIFTFTAKKKGSYDFVCAMGLSHGAKVIVE